MQPFLFLQTWLVPSDAPHAHGGTLSLSVRPVVVLVVEHYSLSDLAVPCQGNHAGYMSRGMGRSVYLSVPDRLEPTGEDDFIRIPRKGSRKLIA